MEIKNGSYCPLPFDTLYSNNTGVYDLCCWNEHSRAKKFFEGQNQWDKVGPIEFFLSKKMDKVREMMLAGEKISMCNMCYKQEHFIGESVRTRFAKQRQPIKVKKINLRIRNFGNHCNLSCVMCLPYNSTTRAKELKELNYNTDDWGKHPGVKYENYNLFKNDLIKNADRLGTISITGGEPFAIPKFWKLLLEEMPRESAKNINLIIETNLTKLEWKNYKFSDLVNRYNEVKLLVSCDHFGDKLKFIRYPIDVDRFELNLQHYKKYIIHLTLTVSLLNVYDLQQIKLYYKENFDLDVTTFSYVKENISEHNPEWNTLSIRNLEQSEKQKLFKKYEHFEETNKHFFTELKLGINHETIKNTRNYLNKLAKKRNMSWDNLWSDLPV